MTECSRCGDCCESIPTQRNRADFTALLANPYFAGEARRDAQFIVDHWQPYAPKFDRPKKGCGEDGQHVDEDCCWQKVGDWNTCDQFDVERRLCGAHADRPPVCRNYPWYPTHPAPMRQADGNWLSVRCSFRADIPEGSPGALLPIVGVT